MCTTSDIDQPGRGLEGAEDLLDRKKEEEEEEMLRVVLFRFFIHTVE